MRCVSLGFLPGPALAAAAAAADARLTNPHLVCVESCVVHVSAVSVAVRGGTPGEALACALSLVEKEGVPPQVRETVGTPRPVRRTGRRAPATSRGRRKGGPSTPSGAPSGPSGTSALGAPGRGPSTPAGPSPGLWD